MNRTIHKTRSIIALILLLVVCVISKASANDWRRSVGSQVRLALYTMGQDTIKKPVDTLKPRVLVPDTSKGGVVKEEPKHFKPTKTPMVAVGLSAVVPGLGQIYNENYWKAPVILGLGGYWVSEWIYNNRLYNDYRDQYIQSLQVIEGQGNGTLLRLRDFYRDERDKFAWYIGVLYTANLIDAYVSAHLYDFDVSPDLGNDSTKVSSVGVKFRWKL